MRPGTVKWYRGKHPVFKCFTGFLADLEDLVGKENVVHGPFGSIKYHPPNAKYFFQYYDSTGNAVKIIGKCSGHMQEFYVRADDPAIVPIIKAFVNYYPDPHYLAYVPIETETKEEIPLGIEKVVLESN